jgi:NAD(P)-dependent dehydrogenase (short-subunit alcohol dehydrogenase family)
MSGRLDNKVAIITGAAQGIGAAIADVFAEEGATLVLFDMKTEPLENLAERLSAKYGSKVLTKTVDVADENVILEKVKEIYNDLQRIDVLINNAGINSFNNVLELSKQDWDRCLSVNLDGVWNCCKAVLPKMIENKYGHIVNIASVHGHKIVRGAFPYAVSKHGLVGLTRALGVEYAASGIRVNSISPGLINTPISETYFNSFSNPEEERRRQEDLLPCKRIGDPREVANTALFLASDEATFINATDILIDGGRSQLYSD